jgi:hypothetical protein
VNRTFEPFLDAAAAAAGLLARPEVAQHWDLDSVLERCPVSALSGHLLRALTTVGSYLESSPSGEDPISAGEYFARLVTSDIDTPANQAIRARGAEMAAGGPAEVANLARATCGQLSERLASADPGRLMKVAGALVMTVGEYLKTRVVEIVVHGDDLAVSVGVAFGPVSPDATGMAISTLVDVARVRHGDLPVLRALARRERDSVQALRVL